MIGSDSEGLKASAKLKVIDWIRIDLVKLSTKFVLALSQERYKNIFRQRFKTQTKTQICLSDLYVNEFKYKSDKV